MQFGLLRPQRLSRWFFFSPMGVISLQQTTAWRVKEVTIHLRNLLLIPGTHDPYIVIYEMCPLLRIYQFSNNIALHTVQYPDRFNKCANKTMMISLPPCSVFTYSSWSSSSSPSPSSSSSSSSSSFSTSPSSALLCNAAVIPDKCPGQTLIPIGVFYSRSWWWWW